MSNPSYRMNRAGFQVVTTDDDGSPRIVSVCDYFRVVADVSDQRANLYGLLVEFSDRHGRQRQVVIPAIDMHGNRAEIEVCRQLAACGLHFDDPEYDGAVYNWIRKQCPPLADLATSTGWVTPAVYALPDKIYGTQDGGRKVYFGGGGTEHRYKMSGTLAQWQAEIAELCQGNSRLLLAVSAAFAAPLMQDSGEPSGGIHLYGESSTGKSTLALVGGSVCGGGDTRKGFVRSWRATSNGLESILSAHNDAALYLDEIAQADPRAIQETIYMLGNSQGKSRMTRTLGSAPTFGWRTMIVSNGERTIGTYSRAGGVELAGGASVRLLDIPADPGAGLGVFEDLHGGVDLDGKPSGAALSDRLQAASLRLYGTAIDAYLSALVGIDPAARRDVIMAYRDDFLSAAHLTGACAEVQRAAKRMGVIAAGGEMAAHLGVVPWSSGAATAGVLSCFSAWRTARGSDAGWDAARAIDTVRGFLERYGQSRFVGVTDGVGANGRVGIAAGSSGGNVIDQAGWRRVSKRGTEFLIQPNYFETQVCKGFDHASVAKALADRGYLRRQGRHNKIKTTIPGMDADMCVYCIAASILTGDQSAA